ncbi:bifunctional DNA primase/polymerase [Streptomyces ficellus]|uniref:Bifunctional DNA primase/polymerase n=1 Tax=Streptomyces ficellus TaxID=1977088 RepID=A0ABT7Z200_9ACTN|nr:bifunctional DNA primase/polymerase [Streptomyces ficellus]MDN3293514.1 bifunctional DNA primase/polymerase [Streptomyces ficellus]
MNNHLLRAALDAAERGWHVFPLRPGSKRPALHGEERCPRTGECASGHRKWEERATTDPARIHRAWCGRPFNVGIATGPSGLLVIDLDMPKNNSSSDTPSGVTTFKALCERAGQRVPTTRTVRTASGGMHLYFTAPPGVRLTNTAGTLAPLVDTRAGGGYVVAPGSITPGGSYVVVDDRPVAPLPGWLCEALQGPRRTPQPGPVPLATSASRYAAAALRNETQAVATAADGTRNHTLLRAARALGRLIATGDLTRAEVEEALSRAAAGNATQPERYYDDVIRRGLDWSIAHNSPRRPA